VTVQDDTDNPPSEGVSSNCRCSLTGTERGLRSEQQSNDDVNGKPPSAVDASGRPLALCLFLLGVGVSGAAGALLDIVNVGVLLEVDLATLLWVALVDSVVLVGELVLVGAGADGADSVDGLVLRRRGRHGGSVVLVHVGHVVSGHEGNSNSERELSGGGIVGSGPGQGGVEGIIFFAP
jgi:hypothetical protein